jgi:hypothetical protein
MDYKYKNYLINLYLHPKGILLRRYEPFLKVLNPILSTSRTNFRRN